MHVFPLSLDQPLCSKSQLLGRPEKWATRNPSADNMYIQNFVIDIQESKQLKSPKPKAVNEQPVWMTQSTVQGESSSVAASSVGKSTSQDKTADVFAGLSKMVHHLQIGFQF